MSLIYMMRICQDWMINPKDRQKSTRNKGRQMPATIKQPILAPLFLALALLIVSAKAVVADTIKNERPVEHAAGAVLDPSVIDPVGKLHQISEAVSQSSNELASISQALDKLNDELARVEKARAGKVTKASFQALQKRFQ